MAEKADLITLEDRALVKISGDEAGDFLGGLVTCETEKMAKGDLKYGALLTPQGKILFDFFVFRIDDGFLLDVHKDQAAQLIQRLMFYKLRRPVEIAHNDDGLTVHVNLAGEKDDIAKWSAVDPRHPKMGTRLYVSGNHATDMNAYHARRIDLGMPEGGYDYAYSSVFPHEALMDQDGGVDFKKGCFVGQEVVSRMQHRGTARSRFVKISATNPLPAVGSVLTADGKTIGTMGSSIGNHGLALVRLDRAADAMSTGADISVNGVPVKLSLPDWVNFSWPEKDTPSPSLAETDDAS